MKKDLSKITLLIDGEEREFEKGFVSGAMLLTALRFKAKFERLTKRASSDLKQKEPDLTKEEHDSEVMNIILVDNNYIGESAKLISQSFGKQFTPEQFIEGTSAGELVNKCQEYVESAINGVAGDVGEDTENLQEESEKE